MHATVEARPLGWVRASIAGLLCALAWGAAAAPAAKEGEAVFARVGETVITQQAYDQAFATAARGKFYHGKPPDQEVAALQREVGDNLINDVLLMAEARRRRLQPNQAEVAKQIESYEARYRSSPMWQANRASVLPPLKKKLEDQNVLEQLQAAVRKVPEPSDKQVEAYYEQNKGKFTEPEQVKVSMILLKVDPSSPQAKWNAAIDEGAAISKRLKGGADFASLAHLHSTDSSAQKGGDMGYLHRGMLPEPAQEAVDKLKPGEVSGAVALLEGVAVLRLDDRKPPKLNPLSEVRQRAHDLLQRDLADRAWADLLARLRRSTTIKVDESRFLPLASAATSAKPPSK